MKHPLREAVRVERGTMRVDHTFGYTCGTRGADPERRGLLGRMVCVDLRCRSKGCRPREPGSVLCTHYSRRNRKRPGHRMHSSGCFGFAPEEAHLAFGHDGCK